MAKNVKLRMPKAADVVFSKADLLKSLARMDQDTDAVRRVLELETGFRRKIDVHLEALRAFDSSFNKLSTNPFVLLIHSKLNSYTRVRQIERDIIPAKQFSSMETSAGRMIEEVALPVYGWETVPSGMHTAYSSIDGRCAKASKVLKLVTLKSGPRCLNDEMSQNFADNILQNADKWAQDAKVSSIDMTYGVLYGTYRISNKKDWHILRNVYEGAKRPTASPDGSLSCAFKTNGVNVAVSVRVGLEWWRHLGGENCFMEVMVALVRACVAPAAYDAKSHDYVVPEIGQIADTGFVPDNYNVSVLQRSQLEWLFFVARHFCDRLE